MKPFNKKQAQLAKILVPFWRTLTLFFASKSHYPVVPSRVLVFDFHLIGDIVLLTPLLSALKVSYPKSRVVLVAGHWAENILLGTGTVDEIVPFSAPWVEYGQGLRGIFSCFKLVRQLRRCHWDLGIEVRGDVRQIFMLWLAGARRRVGFDFTGGESLLTDIVYDDGELAHLGEHHKRICSHLGIWENGRRYIPFLELTPDEKLKASNIPHYIGFHFGASKQLRKFPEHEIVGLLSKFTEAYVSLIVFLPPNCEHEFDSIIGKLPTKVQLKLVLWSGSLRDFIVTASRALHFYCMDSGPAHIVSALSIPATVFFGPAESEYVRPLSNNIEVVKKFHVTCRPCDQVICTNEIHQYCMQGLASKISTSSLVSVGYQH